MKRLLITILCLFLSSTLWAAEPYWTKCFEEGNCKVVSEPVQLARMTPMVVGGGASAAACSYPTKDSSTGTTDDNMICSDSYRGVAYRLTTTSAYQLRRDSISMIKVGSPDCTIVAKRYTDVDNAPGVLLGTSTNSVACSSITTSQAKYDFDYALDDVDLENATNYWTVAIPSAVTTCNSENYVGPQITSSGGGDGSRIAVFAGGNWVVIDNWYKFTWDAKSCN